MTDYFTNNFIRSSFDNEKDNNMIEITQHLAPEQYSYEFPPKSCIMALAAANDDPDQFSFFDECSFTSNSTTAFMYDNADELLDEYLDSFHQSEQHDDDQVCVAADYQLSPLQLPSQVTSDYRPMREESCDSTDTIVLRNTNQPVRPSSFLTKNKQDRINWDETSFVFPDYSSQRHVYPSIHPFSRRNSYEDDDASSNASNQSKVIFMKISKNHVSPPTFIHYSQGSYISTDEGYDDDEDDENHCKELPIESASFFLPLSDDTPQLLDLDAAATKIQAVWRGYISRKNQKPGVSHRVLAGLAHINDSIHRRNYKQLSHQHTLLQKKLEQETAMRMAFEKTMEDMTILMDHQHAVLHERLEQEVKMRQAYERKMDETIAHIQPLEARLRHEAKARADMETMMSRVIDQLQDLRLQVKEQAEQKHILQLKLEQVNNELSSMKKSTTSSSSIRTTPSSVNRTPVRNTPISSSKASPVVRDIPSRTSVRSRASVRSTATPSRTSVRSTATTTTSTTRLSSTRPIVSRK